MPRAGRYDGAGRATGRDRPRLQPEGPSYGGRSTGLAGSSRSGSLHIATTGTTGEHVDGCLFRATVTINGKTIVENGHLTTLDDPDIHAMAKECGPGTKAAGSGKPAKTANSKTTAEPEMID